MPKSFHIGELAQRTGRSIHTIRWYEAQGLIPGVIRDGGGRRVYSELHLSWLDLMERLRRTGMSIAQMRQYTVLVKQGSKTLRRRQVLLSQHRARVQRTIADWTQALKLIDSKIDFYGEWLTTGQRPRLPVAEGQRPASKRTLKTKSRSLRPKRRIQ